MRTLLIALLLGCGVAAVQAQLAGPSGRGPSFGTRIEDWGMGLGGQSGSGGTPPSCSNSLDYSDGCNSQYLPLLTGG